MDDTQKLVAQGETIAPVASKRAYAPPTLFLFGQIGDLTQGSACSAFNDGGFCPALGGSQMGMAASDRRLKQDIVRIGEHPWGFGLYLFRYKPAHREQYGSCRQFGVMADEVERVVPAAVTVHADGYRRVHYGMLGITTWAH